MNIRSLNLKNKLSDIISKDLGKVKEDAIGEVRRGIENAIRLFLKLSPLNKAIAVTGEKLGGWGISLHRTPKIIITSTIF